MPSLTATTVDALSLLISGDVELWEIIGISFRVSCTAILIAAPFAISIGFILAYFDFIGRRLLISIFSTLLAFPAVVVGLVVYITLSNQGVLGDWNLLFSQTAMVIAQIILCLPILISMSHVAFQFADHHAWETARTLGISRIKAFVLILYEVKFGLFAAILAGFGRIIAEVGASMMVGGNILHYTRNIPTAIALETSKGNFSQGIALGMVLLLLAFVLNILLQYVQGRGKLSL